MSEIKRKLNTYWVVDDIQEIVLIFFRWDNDVVMFKNLF